MHTMVKQVMLRCASNSTLACENQGHLLPMKLPKVVFITLWPSLLPTSMLWCLYLPCEDHPD